MSSRSHNLRFSTKMSKKTYTESQSMCRIHLGKITTEFFSDRGNNRLKRIWIDNNLDEEMIFSSWIGPSEAVLRHKVSDYLQTFLLHRSRFVPFRDNDLLSLLRRFSIHCDLTSSNDKQRKHEYYNDYIYTTLHKRYQEREEAERERVERAISSNDIPVLRGYEYVSSNPVFRVQQLEKRIKFLSNIPLPCNQESFEKYILPIMTSEAVSQEKSLKSNFVHKFSRKKNVDKVDRKPKLNTSLVTEDSGVISDKSVTPDLHVSINTATDRDPIKNASGKEVDSKDSGNILDDTLDDICDACAGFVNCDSNDVLLACSCTNDPIWSGRDSQCASTLFEEASKILDLYEMKRIVCNRYMEKFETKTWVD